MSFKYFLQSKKKLFSFCFIMFLWIFYNSKRLGFHIVHNTEWRRTLCTSFRIPVQIQILKNVPLQESVNNPSNISNLSKL